MNTKAEAYSDTHPHNTAPDGTIAMAEVVVFDDGSIHVGGPAIQYGEEYLAASLKTGLELLGYDVQISKNPNGVGDGVEVTSIIDPMDSMMSGPTAMA